MQCLIRIHQYCDTNTFNLSTCLNSVLYFLPSLLLVMEKHILQSGKAKYFFNVIKIHNVNHSCKYSVFEIQTQGLQISIDGVTMLMKWKNLPYAYAALQKLLRKKYTVKLYKCTC